ncbi:MULTISPECIES: SWIM zinc finger family protein [unclassified Nocardioides]|uniref:SWIM zinc finger family protein n=1 Tax=unclassified Nocardioides TaxID=2615069 RepID=UPI0026653903|nr:SWIM zinc finger family protein [Nocardioides sp. Arc9.136]WKN48618.1 SWIM zinc finger family protein [Nocardioides sp. Arc9.136]
MTAPGRGVVHPRVPARRGGARAGTWWARAWLRAAEEAAYDEADLVAARRLARSGRIGGIIVDVGTFVAAVEDDGGLWTTSGTVPVLDEPARQAFVETVAAEAGRVAALLAGDLPHTLVEHAEDAGVELLPYGGELGATCTCTSWTDPCVHALAVLHQLAWLLEGDPFVLLHLRGLPRDELLARLHARSGPAAPEEDPAEVDADTAYDAALRAARALDLLADGRPVDHLF